MWDGTAFSGTKVALVCGADTVAYLRDDKPSITFPGMWDLPGGGREGEEAPIECGLREVEEEFGLTLQQADVIIIERHPSPSGGLDTYFCVVRIEQVQAEKIKFGNEGQRWEMMSVRNFVAEENAVPHLRNRLRVLADQGLV